MKGNAAIAKILKIEGVEFITGFPNTDLQDAVAEQNIRYIGFRTEKAAIGAADGFSRVSFGKRIGVCSVMVGPGIGSAFPGIRQAYSDGVPILVLPSGDPRRRVSTHPNLDTVRVFREVTKWADSLVFADEVPEKMRRAFTHLRMGQPGPVLINIPSDVGLEEFDDALFQYKPVKPTRSEGDPADVKAVAKALIAAKNPVIRAGQGVLWSCACDELRELAELLQIPVYTTMSGKSAFPENHPLSLGTGGPSKTKMVMYFQQKADLVFAIGSSCTREFQTAIIPASATLIQLTIGERDINRDYCVEHSILGDAKLTLRQLIEEVKKQVGSKGRKGNDAVAREIQTVKAEFLEEWMPKFNSDEVPINPLRVIWDLMKVLDTRETIVIHEPGAPRDHLVPFWQCVEPGSYIGYGKDHMLGGGLGLAIGAKLGRPDKTVIYMCGDGAFGQNGMDYETQVRERIPILNIVLNNGVLSSSKVANPIACERYGLNVLTGNYSEIGKGPGCYTERVKKPSEIIPAIQRAKKMVDSGTPVILEIMSREETAAPYRRGEQIKT